MSVLLHFCSFKIDNKKANEVLLSLTSHAIKVKYPIDSKINKNIMDRVCNMAKLASVMDPTLMSDVCSY